MEIIKIPTDRVSALVGNNGEIKKIIEAKCIVKLNIASDGEVEIDGETANIFFAKDVVKAIGRGFKVHDALKILDEDFNFFLIDLDQYVKSDKAIIRIRGRIIGEEGTMKTEIEAATDSYLSIYGDTVGIISKIDSMEYAKEAVFMLIEGAQHASVFAYLAKAKQQIIGARLRN
ncbi:MAG: KH domain-containing protein [Candidatus Micrarchaeota archaeon]|nr:KH domain-containing protein [Candidatus Micrarchaeota archaeon]